jgi:hypothetical protein
MPDAIQPRDRRLTSKGSGSDGILYISSQSEWQPLCPLSLLERWSVELELQLA